MLLTCENIIKILPIIRLELYNKENSFLIPSNLLIEILTIFKTHYIYQFKILSCISGVDYPENFYRFQIVYELLSLKFNSRVRLKVLTTELIPVDSIEKIFSGASW